MKNPRIVVSLPNDNAYQHAQALAAKSAAARLGVSLEVMHAEDDPITQSQQLLGAVQARPELRPDGIVVEPATGTGLRRVAQAAVAAKIAWVISNSDVDYVRQLRNTPGATVFAVTQGQVEIGRVQGRQIAALLPQGGSILFVQGPSTSSVAQHRNDGMESTRPRGIVIKKLKSKWSEEDAYRSVTSWLRLRTVRAEDTVLVAGQTHELALGARRAFQEVKNPEERKKWLGLPFIGIGISSQAEPLVDRGILTAAVITSVTMEMAIEMLVRALQTGIQPQECTWVEVSSYPSLEKLGQASQTLSRIVASETETHKVP